MKKLKLALIGKSIEHSLSESIYRKFFPNLEYHLIDKQTKNDLPSLNWLFKNYDGVSVTSPYKKNYFDQVETEVPKKLGIINTIKLSLDKASIYQGVLTDLTAYRRLFPTYYNRPDKSLPVVVLGDGAMGKMVVQELRRTGFHFCQVSRKNKKLNQGYMNHLSKSEKFYINTCSRNFVFNYSINPHSIFWDFNYNFSSHEILSKTCRYISGISLLEEQARHSLIFWGLKGDKLS